MYLWLDDLCVRQIKTTSAILRYCHGNKFKQKQINNMLVLGALLDSVAW